MAHNNKLQLLALLDKERYTQSQVEEVLRTAAPKDRPHETRDWVCGEHCTARIPRERGLMNALQQQRLRADLMQLEGRDPREIEGHET